METAAKFETLLFERATSVAEHGDTTTLFPRMLDLFNELRERREVEG